MSYGNFLSRVTVIFYQKFNIFQAAFEFNAGRDVSQSVSQSDSQSVRQLTNESGLVSQPESVSRSVSRNQSVGHSFNQSVSQSVRSISLSVLESGQDTCGIFISETFNKISIKLSM